MVFTDSFQKPLMLFHLIHVHGVKNALVFTKSAESTARLVRLLEFIGEAIGESGRVYVRAFSSDLTAGERAHLLENFKNQKTQM